MGPLQWLVLEARPDIVAITTICARLQARLPPCASQQIADNTQQHIGGELVCASIECLGHLAAHCSNARGNFYMDIEHYIEPLPLEHCTLC